MGIRPQPHWMNFALLLAGSFLAIAFGKVKLLDFVEPRSKYRWAWAQAVRLVPTLLWVRHGLGLRSASLPKSN